MCLTIKFKHPPTTRKRFHRLLLYSVAHSCSSWSAHSTELVHHRWLKWERPPGFIRARISTPQHYWHFGPDNSLVWSCPVHHWLFSNIPGLYPLDAHGTHHHLPKSLQSKHFQTLPNVPRGQMAPDENHWFRSNFPKAFHRVLTGVPTPPKKTVVR